MTRFRAQMSANAPAITAAAVAVAIAIAIAIAIFADAPVACAKSANDSKPAKDGTKPTDGKPINYFAMGKSSTAPHRSSDTRASFTIVGTDCYTCVERMKRKFKRVPGVKKVYIMCWEPYEAFVNFDSTKTSWPQIAAAIADEKAQLTNVKIEPLLPKTKPDVKSKSDTKTK